MAVHLEVVFIQMTAGPIRFPTWR